MLCRYLLLACLHFALTSVLSAQVEAPRKLRLGATLPLTGPWASWGTELRQGLEIAAAQHPEFEITFMDDQCEAIAALSNVRSMLARGSVQGIIGGCVEILEAIGPVLQRAHVPLFALGGMDEQLLQRNPLLVSLFALSDIEARYLARHISSVQPKSKIAVLHHSQRFGVSFGDGFESTARRLELEVRAREQLPLDGVDFRAEVTRVLSLGVDTLVIHMGEGSLVALLEEIRHQGFQGKIFTTHVLEGVLKKLPAGAVPGSIEYTYPGQMHVDSTQYRNFVELYKSRFGQLPAVTSPVAFDALEWMVEAYRTCPSERPSCLKDNFRSRVLSGASGELQIDSLGRSFRPFGLKSYVNGETRWLQTRLPSPD